MLGRCPSGLWPHITPLNDPRTVRGLFSGRRGAWLRIEHQRGFDRSQPCSDEEPLIGVVYTQPRAQDGPRSGALYGAGITIRISPKEAAIALALQLSPERRSLRRCTERTASLGGLVLKALSPYPPTRLHGHRGRGLKRPPLGSRLADRHASQNPCNITIFGSRQKPSRAVHHASTVWHKPHTPKTLYATPLFHAMRPCMGSCAMHRRPIQ